MIKLDRAPTPAILQEKETKWVSELCIERSEYYNKLADFEAGKLTKPPRKPRARNSRYAHPQIVEVLENMLHGKCAYC